MLDALPQHVEQDGYAIAPDAVPQELLRELDQALDAGHAGARNLLGVPVVRNLAASDPVRLLVEPVLGPSGFAVRGILFNKLPGANWKVPWHQDCAIAVCERMEVPGWGSWSVKGEVPTCARLPKCWPGCWQSAFTLTTAANRTGRSASFRGRTSTVSSRMPKSSAGRRKRKSHAPSVAGTSSSCGLAAARLLHGSGASQPPSRPHRVRRRGTAGRDGMA